MLLDTCGRQKKKFQMFDFQYFNNQTKCEVVVSQMFVICDNLKEFHIDYYYIYCIQCVNSTQCLFSGLCSDP